MIAYTFPFDSLDVQKSNHFFKNISIEKNNNNAKIEFDANRGDFITLSKGAFINLDFNQILVDKEYAKFEINFFMKLNNASDINSILIINDSQTNSIFQIDELTPEENLKIITNTWLNVNISIQNNKIVASIFDSYRKEIDVNDVKSIKFLGSENPVSFSQLSIIEDGELAKEIAKASDDLHKNINVNIHTANANVPNQLIIEEEPKEVFVEIDFSIINVNEIPKNTMIGKLKAKKGFFNNTENAIIDEVDISTQFQERFDNNKLVVKLPNIKVLNLADQDQALTQVELFNMSLNNNGIEESNSLKIDQQVTIVDKRGLNICPFDLFVLGNDTLYNGADNSAQEIKLLITNISGADLNLTNNSGFKVSTNFNTILKGDALQTKNIKLLTYDSLTNIPSSDNDNYICFQNHFSLSNNKSIVLFISGLQAKLPEKSNPSGAYPFYLEYKNIPGYRNGKVKCFIKTGKIFLLNNNNLKNKKECQNNQM